MFVKSEGRKLRIIAVAAAVFALFSAGCASSDGSSGTESDSVTVSDVGAGTSAGGTESTSASGMATGSTAASKPADESAQSVTEDKRTETSLTSNTSETEPETSGTEKTVTSAEQSGSQSESGSSSAPGTTTGLNEAIPELTGGRKGILELIGPERLKNAAKAYYAGLESENAVIVLPEGAVMQSEMNDLTAVVSMLDLESRVMPESFSYYYDHNMTVTKIEPSKYLKTAAEYAAEKEATLKKAEEIVSLAEESCPTEFDKVLFFHDYICENCTYDLSASNGASSYGCLVEGAAVCEGYSKAMTLLCSQAGIDCVMVIGYGTNNGSPEPHMWNLINIDGCWTHVDATWDDVESIGQGGLISYCFFGMTDSEISLSHSASDMGMLTYPEAEGNTANYYVRKGYLISSEERLEEVLRKAVFDAAKAGETAVSVRCADAELFEKVKDTDRIFALIDEAEKEYGVSIGGKLSVVSSSNYRDTYTYTFCLTYDGTEEES